VSTGTDLASLADAKAAYPFPLVVPTAIPAGYQLKRINYCCPGFPATVLVLYYQAPDKPPLTLVQGPSLRHPVPPNNDPSLACLGGTTIVEGEPAVWVRNQYNINAPQGVCKPENAGRLLGPEVEWAAAGDAPQVGYQLTSDGFSLDQLVVIADSVQPYQGP